MASLVSPQSERQVPPRTACVAGRHLEVIERSCPVVRFISRGLGAAGEEGKGQAPRHCANPRGTISASTMTSAPASQRDPLGWTIAIALAFVALC